MESKIGLEIMRNMRGLMDDFKIQCNRYPTNEEFEERLSITHDTVVIYKKIIRKEDVKSLKDHLEYELYQHLNDFAKTIEKSIKVFEEVRDSKTSSNTDKMNACRYIIDTQKAIFNLAQYIPKNYLDDTSKDEADNDDNNEDMYNAFRSLFND